MPAFILIFPAGSEGSPRSGEFEFLTERRSRRHSVKRKPRLRRGQPAIYILDIFHALIAQPIFQSLRPIFAVNGNGVFPSRASAQASRKIDASFGREVQSFGECVVAYSGGKIDERF